MPDILGGIIWTCIICGGVLLALVGFDGTITVAYWVRDWLDGE